MNAIEGEVGIRLDLTNRGWWERRHSLQAQTDVNLMLSISCRKIYFRSTILSTIFTAFRRCAPLIFTILYFDVSVQRLSSFVKSFEARFGLPPFAFQPYLSLASVTVVYQAPA